MNNNLLQALIAAGLRPAAAGRVASAIQDVATRGTANTATTNSRFSRPAGSGFQVVAGSPESFALFASAIGTTLNLDGTQTLFGPGGGALGVSGVSVFDGDIYCSSTGAFGSLAVEGGVQVGGSLAARDVAAGVTLSCGSAAQFSGESATITVPLSLDGDLSVAGQAAFNDDVTLNQQLSINGNVVWGQQARVPANVPVITAIGADGNAVLLTPGQVAVLNDFGRGRQQKLTYEIVPITKQITDLIEFDEETCTIVAKLDAPEVLVGGTIKITAT